MVIDIDERLPSWNLFYAGQNHHVRTALKNKWRMLVRAALTGDEEMFTQPVSITVSALYKSRPVDVDNLCVKLVIDGLKGIVLRDDDPSCVESLTLESLEYERDGVLVYLYVQED